MRNPFYKWKLGLVCLFSKKKYREIIEDKVWTYSERFLTEVLKHRKAFFVTSLVFSEFTRKMALHKIGVPMFVINSEPLLNIASYVSSLYFLVFIAIGLFVFVWSVPKFTGRPRLRWIGQGLAFLWIVAFVLLIRSISFPPEGLNEWKTGSGALVYISDTYEVVTTEGTGAHVTDEVLTQVFDKRSRVYYRCVVKDSHYSDMCRKMTKKDVIIEAQ